MEKIVSASVLAAIVATGVIALAGVQVTADDEVPPIVVPSPCDFITGGGFIFSALTMDKANFGAHGGCKHGSFWGHVNYVDHGGFLGKKPFHVQSTEITGYFVDPSRPKARIICGVAKTNAGASPVTFRVVMEDNGEPGNTDTFEIELSTPYLAKGVLLGGDIQLHKGNRSTTPPSTPLNLGDLCPGLGGLPPIDPE